MSARIRLSAFAVGTVGVALALSGCASSGATGAGYAPTQASSSAAPAGTSSSGQTLTVFAAASLTDTFGELAKTFETQHPGVTVSLSFGGSSDLVSQITEGAPADVFASADEATMQTLTDAKLADGMPTDFATNVLTIVTPPDNPANVTGLKDLTKASTKVDLCAAEVPCGAAALAVEKAAGVTIKPVSEESAVTDVLAKVESGDADAGLVYVTDAAGAGNKVKQIDFPESSKVVNTYPIVPVADSSHAALAKEFVALVTGSTGQAVLHEAGFGAAN